MSDTPRIAMTPEQLPRQRIHEVVALPPEPADFDPVVCYGSDALGIFPKQRPSRDALPWVDRVGLGSDERPDHSLPSPPWLKPLVALPAGPRPG